MARQFKFQTWYGPGAPSELYIHDDDKHELTTIPPLMTEKQAEDIMHLYMHITEFGRKYGLTKLHMDKV